MPTFIAIKFILHVINRENALIIEEFVPPCSDDDVVDIVVVGGGFFFCMDLQENLVFQERYFGTVSLQYKQQQNVYMYNLST